MLVLGPYILHLRQLHHLPCPPPTSPLFHWAARKDSPKPSSSPASSMPLSTSQAACHGTNRALRFFFTQALGIIVGSCVEEALGGFFVQKAEGSPKSPLTPWVRMLGYVWTSVFMVWSTPAYLYPTISRAEGVTSDVSLPFSVVRLPIGAVDNDRLWLIRTTIDFSLYIHTDLIGYPVSSM